MNVKTLLTSRRLQRKSRFLIRDMAVILQDSHVNSTPAIPLTLTLVVDKPPNPNPSYNVFHNRITLANPNANTDCNLTWQFCGMCDE